MKRSIQQNKLYHEYATQLYNSKEVSIWDGKNINLCYNSLRPIKWQPARISLNGYPTSHILHSEDNHMNYKYQNELKRVWYSMLNRCHSETNGSYFKYGKRGITVCEEWRKDFFSFYKWGILNGYSTDLSIDRIDPYGNYEPSNCRWADTTTQARNTRLIYAHNKSGYRGVSFSKTNHKWRSCIHLNNKRLHIGYFVDKMHAAMAYDTFVIVYGLEHTKNFP